MVNKRFSGVSRVLAAEGDLDGNASLCNVAGTLSYMAPEVGANLLTTCEYDYSVDIWSLGSSLCVPSIIAINIRSV